MYDQKKVSECFKEWEAHLNEKKIPKWEELPSLELYMDQVLVLLNKYTDIFIITDGGNAITAPMINN